MKKAALIFVLAVFVPALILGGLALRAASSQRIVLERQETELRQRETDAVAALIRAAIAAEHQKFVEAVDRLLREYPDGSLAAEFNRKLSQDWRPDVLGFAVTLGGRILSPSDGAGAEEQAFLKNNTAWFSNRLEAQVYQTDPDVLSQLAPQAKIAKEESSFRRRAGSRDELQKDLEEERQDTRRTVAGAFSDQAEAPGAAPEAEAVLSGDKASEKKAQAAVLREKASGQPQEMAAARTAPVQQVQQWEAPLRKVAPQKQMQQPNQPMVSALNVETSLFQQIVTTQNEGILARFVQDQLEILFWVRSTADPDHVFGARLLPRDLHEWLDPLLKSETAQVPGACIALLDDRAQPFARSVDGFVGEWKRPFVATEVGEVLPHWEVALYLLDPGAIEASARLVNYTLAGLIALALGAILWGGYMVVAETRKQLLLVQKKTDFVSNVSHELKTPLTSIRMFAELLHENRVTDPAKREKYLRVITLEADRLTRLINNVLDFAKIERNQKRYHKRPLDFYPVLRKLWEAQEMHLQGEGFTTAWHDEPGPYPIVADEDALSQVIVNLLSNAEKYSTERKDIELHSYRIDGTLAISVLDRGLGIPPGEEQKIFESFYRAHDSLSSGIQGSGLGLTLARRIAAEHGGDITVERRQGGGTSFTLRIPLSS